MSTDSLLVDNFLVSEVSTIQERLRRLAAQDRLLQPSDIDASSATLAYAERHGLVHQIINGVYIGADHVQHPLIEVAAWTLHHPLVVGGLVTAAVHHQLTTAFERGSWLFVPLGSSPPRSRTRDIHVIQATGKYVSPQFDALNGIIRLQIHGVQIRITDPDRTTIDLWRYPRHIPAEFALDALRRRTRARDFRIADFARLARRLSAWSRIEPVVQGMLFQ